VLEWSFRNEGGEVAVIREKTCLEETKEGVNNSQTDVLAKRSRIENLIRDRPGTLQIELNASR
jgi:hypothetical protein